MCDKKCLNHQVENLLGRLRGKISSGENLLAKSPESKEFRLGDILIAFGQLTREQLNETLDQQKVSTKKIGELLVERGLVQQNYVEHGLRLQQLLISAALGTTMALCGPAPSEAGDAIASFTATATVKSTARMMVVHQSHQLIITSEDIVQGFVEMPAASRIEVRNSSLFGYMISFEAQEGPFQRVLVRGLGRELQLGSGSSWLLRPHVRGPEILELTYRFMLKNDALPGTYPWPLQLSVAAV